MKPKEVLLLLLLTLGAVLVHGYHPAAEDAELYLPAVMKILHPEFYSFNAQFFESHAQLTCFPNLVAFSLRFSHLPAAVVLLLWHVASIYLFLIACWQLSGRCFEDRTAQWGSVVLLAALLTLPIAGTALYIMDQYVNPRNVAAFATIVAIVKIVDKKYAQALLFVSFVALIHPLMAAFAASYCLLLSGMQRLYVRRPATAYVLLFELSGTSSAAYHPAAVSHAYFCLLHWRSYEWLGVVSPLAMLWWFSRCARSRQEHQLRVLCQSLLVYQIVFLVFGLALSCPRFEELARIQPMRSLYLLYILLFIVVGGLLAEFVLRDRLWRWLVLFVPLCLAMFFAQRSLFPASAHVEWPGATPRNPWVKAFEWIRNNTPPDAVFALDPSYMKIRGEDANGFNAITQRSRLADVVRDGGAVSMFPAMAEQWQSQLQALRGWEGFGLQDFQRLQADFGVTWVVLQRSKGAGLECRYRNEAVSVCEIPPGSAIARNER